MTSFDEMYARMRAEAIAEGPDAVAELRVLEDRYRLAQQLIARRRELGMTQPSAEGLSILMSTKTRLDFVHRRVKRTSD